MVRDEIRAIRLIIRAPHARHATLLIVGTCDVIPVTLAPHRGGVRLRGTVHTSFVMANTLSYLYNPYC